MQTKQKLLLRKSLHLGLLIPFTIFWYLSSQSSESAQVYARLFLATWVLLFLVYEYVRLDTKSWVPFTQFIKPKERYSNVDGLNLVLMGIVVHSLFSFPIAVTAILIAIIGDTTSTIGSIYGRIKVFPDTNNKTTWKAVILSITINLLVAVSILGFNYISLGMAIIGVVIETITIKLDDNLAVPFGVAVIGQLLS